MSKRWLWLLPLLALVGSGYWYWTSQYSVDHFLQRHWQFPIPPQGKPPADFSSLEASLDPAACGSCHVDQYRQWRDSLHSHTMGPGILWQLQIADVKTATSCLRCHAPMSEQLALLSQARGWSASRAQPPAYIPQQLHRQGLVCAACHVRAHQRYGPPPNKSLSETLPHNGFTQSRAFQDSRFCATCHQFSETGPRLNGKLREDTYNQWRKSDYGRQGKHCQSCHMPDRQHLWKGIHDPAMTASALTVAIDLLREGNKLTGARATVTNTGAGHDFPTYLVPEVQLLLEQVTPAGEIIPLAQQTIGWRANVALTREIYDRRLAPGASISLEAPAEALQPEGRLRLRVRVSPGAQYIRTFDDYLANRGRQLQPAVRKQVQQAIRQAREARYEFVAAERVLPRIAN